MKVCTICNTEKAVIEFYRHSMTADGHYPWCKDCHKERCRQNRKSDVKAYREKQRKRAQTDIGKEIANRAYKKALTSGKHTQRTSNWRAKNPEKYKAHLEVKKALYNGLLNKVGCIVCGKDAQAHHEDYAKPLEVMWLCKTHHAEHHMRKRSDV